MVTRVLDTSVVAKWFFQEERSDSALAHLTELLEGRLRIMVPSSLFYELANVLWTRRSKTFTERQAREVWAELTTLPISVAERANLFPEALTLAFQHDVAAYDAVFVVLARRLGCDFITDDRMLWERIAGECPWVKRL